ncbi:MAG: hypothetical protein OJF52_003826 [Nitrospira sp.]|jgi:predicted SprT family Zn-dependent metalloprotease|nr:MAG: hypothetical protein OJF52_003826 [Nitrospira sp.]
MSPLSPAVEPLLTLWTDLNARYFRGTLPAIRIEWSRRLTSSAGMFVCRVGPREVPPQRTGDATRRCIKLSAVLLHGNGPHQSRETLTTFAHEMIHQWQYDILKRRPNHGADFRRMMGRMNQDGLGITVYHSLGQEVASLAKYAWRCQQCGDIYRRQRRTIQPKRHRCGSCRGPLREVVIAEDDGRPDQVQTTDTGSQLVLPFKLAEAFHVRTLGKANSLR